MSRVWKKSEFCCLFCLYAEPERRVRFVVCLKLTLLSVSVYKQNKQQNSLFFQTLDITKTNNKTHSSFSLCLYIEPERRVCFVVCLVIYRAWKKSEFCCLFCLYTETERGVCFVLCFGYIQSLSGSVYNQNKQQNSLFFQSLYINKTNNKTPSSFRPWI
jgi:hypothetical protein